MANVIRSVVSKKKRRFQEGGFDLDLTYISDRIIAMGFPSEKLEGIYRNPMSEVQRFLKQLHKDNYKVYNLCSERRYDHARFNGRVAEFPFDDHNPAPLEVVSRFCKDIDHWLDSHPENVAVVHCKAGKGRTGTMICCYLMYSGRCNSASEALQLFATRRTLNHKGVTLHSQRRYVRYFEKVLQEGPPEKVILKLQRIRMHTVPNFQMKGGSEPWFSITRKDKTLYLSDPLKGKKGNQVVDFECGNTIVSEDIRIEFFNKNLKNKMFYFWFHCAYVKNYYFCLRKRELDKACKDKQCKHFAPGFKVELFFLPVNENEGDGDTTGRNAGDTVSATIVGVCGSCGKSCRADEETVNLKDNVLMHWDCLTCDKCGRHFGKNKNVVIMDGKAVCDRCDNQEFFSRCASCFRVLNEYRCVQVGDLGFHEDCFRCGHCQIMLKPKDETVVIRNGFPFCAEHANAGSPTITCASSQCLQANNPNAPLLKALGNDWHADCFRCVECGLVLDPEEGGYVDKDGAPCCSHHDQVFCARCGEQIIRSQAVNALGTCWHDDCLTCSAAGCRKKLDPRKDDVKLVMGNPTCGHHQVTKCERCKELIWGEDDLAIFNENSYHASSCLVCSVCGDVLAPDPDAIKIVDGSLQCAKHSITCSRCGTAIDANDLKEVFGETWHTQCVPRCELASCALPFQEDAEIVELDGKFYCSSHPHCTQCGEPIADQDLHQDENGAFHRGCYTCKKCNAPLQPDNCDFFEGDLLCPECHPGPFCDACGYIIIEGHIMLLDRRYHEECFQCNQCKEPFATVDDPVCVDDGGLPVCAKCGENSVICQRCNEKITSQVVEAMGKSFHPECFTCSKCSRRIVGEFAVLNDDIVCLEDFSKSQRPSCVVCARPLVGRYAIVSGKNMHFDCFKCSNCGKSFQTQGSKYYTLPDKPNSYYCGACRDQYRGINDRGVTQTSPHEENNISQSPDSEEESHLSKAERRRSVTHSSAAAFVQTRRASRAANTKSAAMSDGSSEASSSLTAPSSVSGSARNGNRMDFSRPSSFDPRGQTREEALNNPRPVSIGLEDVPGHKQLTESNANKHQMKTGYLKKQGGNWKNWKKRWFVLSGPRLRYFVKEADNSYLGEIVLTPQCNVELGEKRDNSIILQTPDRVWKFVAFSEKDMNEWFEAIRQHIWSSK